MSDAIRDLWPEIDVTVLSTIAVLKFQAGQLREKTQGLLEGNVKPWTSKDGDQVYDFEIVAPALDRYTYALFQAWHKPDFVYPVTVRFSPWIEEAKAAQEKKNRGIFGSRILLGMDADSGPSGIRIAASPKEFLDILKELLGSAHTKAVLSSLIARTNDTKQQQQSSPLPNVGQDAPPQREAGDADVPTTGA